MILELYHVLHVECLILFCAAIIAYQIKDLTLEEGVWWSCINWKYIIYWAIFFLYKTPLKHKNDNMTVNVNIIITTLHSYIWRWILVYNQWLFRLHLYLFPPLLQFVCLFFFFTFSPPPPNVFVCWWHWSADTLFDSCQTTITWMSTIQLDTDCICLGHLATILVANRWKRNCFSAIFLKISYIHSSHLCSLSNVPPHLPQCWATCILETTVIAKSTLGKGKRTQVFQHFWRALY